MYLNVKIDSLQQSHSDEQPTTSGNAKKHNSPKKKLKSPWKNRGGKVNRFKKIKDDQARKLVRRSVSIITDNEIPKKFTCGKKGVERFVNNNKEITSPNAYKIKKSTCQKTKHYTLEEGEIVSENDSTLAQIQRVESDDDDGDDCIVIEPTVEEIVIEDDDDAPSTSSSLSTSYQSLIKSFNHRMTSTPCNKNITRIINQRRPGSATYAVVPEIPLTDNETPTEPLLFFEDVAGKSCFDSINSTDNFTDYTKLSTLRENPILKRRSVRLKNQPSKEIIDLDDGNLSNNSTLKPHQLKRKSCELDDSVIFISETNQNDFISIQDTNNPKYKVMKQDDNPSTHPTKIRANNLHTKSETKQLNAYNENAYNPSAGTELKSGKRMVIIDGSNVAFKHSCDKAFSVKGLKIAIEYFEKIGHEVKAVIPQFRMNKTKSSDPEELDRLHKDGKIVQTPCKNLPGLTSTSYDDRFILQLAFELDAAIVSNDNYRDLLHENPAFKKIIENRVIGYTWCNDIFILPKDPYGKWGPTLQTILNRC